MELQQLEAMGMKYCLEEFSLRSDLCSIEVCCKCRCIVVTCYCKERESGILDSYRVLLPLSSIKAIIGMRVCSSVDVELTPQIG